jgi:hypothetical protein
MISWLDSDELPSDLKAVLLTISDALGGRKPNADLVRTIAHQCHPDIPGHKFSIEYTPRPPKGSQPRSRALYVISIRGHRTDGRWQFWPSQLVGLLSELSR